MKIASSAVVSKSEYNHTVISSSSVSVITGTALPSSIGALNSIGKAGVDTTNKETNTTNPEEAASAQNTANANAAAQAQTAATANANTGTGAASTTATTATAASGTPTIIETESTIERDKYGNIISNPSSTVITAIEEAEGKAEETPAPKTDTLEIADSTKAYLEQQAKEQKAAYIAAIKNAAGFGKKGRVGGYNQFGVQKAKASDFGEITTPDKMKLKLIESLLSNVLGKKVKLNLFEYPKDRNTAGATASDAVLATNEVGGVGGGGTLSGCIPQQSQGTALNLSGLSGIHGTVTQAAIEKNANAIAAAREQLVNVETTVFSASRYESESISYQSQGIVRTEDGGEIKFDVNMYMARESAVAITGSYAREVVRCDPLVVNYGGNNTKLTAEKYDFDLDLDGNNDKISFVGQGSGFLALDKNGDGKINDGSELFGPQTNDGFEELRAYDQDGNGWIDENDDIYSKLRIWSKDEQGNDQLYTLKEVDVGAIYLGDISTKYNLGQGELTSTSIFLKDHGGAGTVSHIDLNI